MSKRPVEMLVVGAMRGKVDDRGLRLIQPTSRAARLHDIHELILTDRRPASRTEAVDRVAYLAFGEVVQGGLIIVDDEVYLGARRIGAVLGFDDSHMPNHQNIILFSENRQDGVELKITVGARLSILAPTSVENSTGEGSEP
jgi:hypothetical protein